MLVPFSFFHLVRENVYPAALLLIRGHCPRGATETETEGERLLCSMRGIHRVLNWDIVTFGYSFSEKPPNSSVFSYSRHLPPTGCSETQRMCFSSVRHKDFCLVRRLRKFSAFSIDPKTQHSSQNFSVTKVDLWWYSNNLQDECIKTFTAETRFWYNLYKKGSNIYFPHWC